MDDSCSEFDNETNSITEVPRMSTFLHNMETLGGLWDSHVQVFHRNLDVIRDSIVHREPITLKHTTGSNRDYSSRQGLPMRTVSNISSKGNPGNNVPQGMLLDGSQSTIDSDCNDGGEIIRNVAFPPSSSSYSGEPPSFWETRLETFASNIDTLSEILQTGGTLGITIGQDVDDEEGLADDLHLTI